MAALFGYFFVFCMFLLFGSIFCMGIIQFLKLIGVN
jgi:hypothetical protein